MRKPYEIIADEHTATIRDIQKNPSKSLRGITRVIRSGKTIGFFFSHEEFDELLEDMEALASPQFKRRVKQARIELKKGATTSLDEVLKRYGV